MWPEIPVNLGLACPRVELIQITYMARLAVKQPRRSVTATSAKLDSKLSSAVNTTARGVHALALSDVSGKTAPDSFGAGAACQRK